MSLVEGHNHPNKLLSQGVNQSNQDLFFISYSLNIHFDEYN